MERRKNGKLACERARVIASGAERGRGGAAGEKTGQCVCIADRARVRASEGGRGTRETGRGRVERESVRKRGKKGGAKSAAESRRKASMNKNERGKHVKKYGAKTRTRTKIYVTRHAEFLRYL